MKMKIADRILLALYSLLGVIATAGLALLIIYRESVSINLFGKTLALGNGVAPLLIIAAIALVLLVWSVRMFLLAFAREPRPEKNSVAVQNTEDGSVRISVAAMDTLIKQAIGQQDGVISVKSRIINHEDSISVQVDMTLTSEVHIPNVTMLLQRTIKNFVEEYSGIAVREVTVLVSSIVEVVPAQLKLESTTPEPIVQTFIDAADDPQPAEPAAEPEPVLQPEPDDEAVYVAASDDEGEPDAEKAPEDEIFEDGKNDW